MKESKVIELRSEKIRNIIGKMPPLLLRIGISVIACVLLVIVGLLYFIPYPQTTTFPIKICSENNGSAYYATARLTLTEARPIKVGQEGLISIQCLQGDYNLSGEVHDLKESDGKVDVYISLTDPEKYSTHFKTHPNGVATIYVSRSSILKRLAK